MDLIISRTYLLAVTFICSILYPISKKIINTNSTKFTEEPLFYFCRFGIPKMGFAYQQQFTPLFSD